MKNSCLLTIVLSVGCSMFIFSCKKSDTPVSLETTKWIESKERTDTLVFVEKEIFTLNRPKELRNGYMIPKYGSGLYFFKELKDSIELYNSVSSSRVTKNYPFKIESNKLYIGDFYLNSGKLLVFERLK